MSIRWYGCNGQVSAGPRPFLPRHRRDRALVLITAAILAGLTSVCVPDAT